MIEPDLIRIPIKPHFEFDDGEAVYFVIKGKKQYATTILITNNQRKLICEHLTYSKSECSLNHVIEIIDGKIMFTFTKCVEHNPQAEYIHFTYVIP